jgi:hypothetical protein
MAVTTYDPPIGRAHYRHFKVPDEWKDVIKLSIGREGCNFIRATKRSGCKYIWHHRDTDIIEVWGPQDKVIRGEKCIRDIARRYINGRPKSGSEDTVGAKDQED